MPGANHTSCTGGWTGGVGVREWRHENGQGRSARWRELPPPTRPRPRPAPAPAVEMVSMHKRVEVAVLDEIQMIGDDARCARFHPRSRPSAAVRALRSRPAARRPGHLRRLVPTTHPPLALCHPPCACFLCVRAGGGPGRARLWACRPRRCTSAATARVRRGAGRGGASVVCRSSQPPPRLPPVHSPAQPARTSSTPTRPPPTNVGPPPPARPPARPPSGGPGAPHLRGHGGGVRGAQLRALHAAARGGGRAAGRLRQRPARRLRGGVQVRPGVRADGWAGWWHPPGGYAAKGG